MPSNIKPGQVVDWGTANDERVVANAFRPLDFTPQQVFDEDPGFFDVLGAGLRQESPIFSWYERLSRNLNMTHEQQPDFDLGEFSRGTLLEQFPDAASSVTNEHDARLVLETLRRQVQDREWLRESGMLGFVAGMAGGLIDPIALVPVGGVAYKSAKTASILAGGLRTAYAAAVGVTASEAALLASQDVRTYGESAVNIGGATVLSGIMGSAVTAVSKKWFSQATKQFESDMDLTKNLGTGPGDEIVIDSIDSDIMPTLEGALGAEKAAKLIGITPNTRILSRDSAPAKHLALELSESVMRFKEGKAGVTFSPGGAIESTINTNRGMWMNPQQASDSLYKQYTKRVAGRLRNKATGKALDDSFAGSEIVARGDRLNHADFMEEVSFTRRAGNQVTADRPARAQAAKPELEAAAKRYGDDLLDNLGNRAAKVQAENPNIKLVPKDLSPSGAVAYLSRMFNKQSLPTLKNGDNELFVQVVQRGLKRAHPDMPDDEALSIAQQIQQSILNQSDARLSYEAHPISGTSAFKERQLDFLTDEELAPWLENNIQTIGRRYYESVMPDLLLLEKYGSVDINEWKPWKAMLKDYAKRSSEATSERARLKISKELDANKADLEFLVEMLRRNHVGGSDKGAFFPTALRTARTMNLVSQLGGVTLTSATDVGSVMLRNGIWRTMKVPLIDAVTNMKGLRATIDENKLYAIGSEWIVDGRAAKITDVGENFGQRAMNGWEKMLDKMSRNFSYLSLLTPWNAMMKKWAGVVVHGKTIKAIMKEAGGTLSAKQAAKLRSLNITPEMSRRMADQIGKHGENFRGMQTAGLQHWIGTPDGQALANAISKQVDSVIVTPGIGDRPIMMVSNEVAKTVFQYKTFAIATIPRLIIPTLQAKEMSALSGAMAMVGIGMIAYSAKSKLANRETSEDPRIWLQEGIDRSGLFLWMTEPMNILDKVFGLGPSRILGGEGVSRYAARNRMGALLGPTFDSVGKAAQVISGATGPAGTSFSQSDLKALRRLTPFQNLFYVQGIFNAVENHLAGGLPERRTPRPRSSRASSSIRRF